MLRHNLHIDQGGVLEAELLLLLVGQSTPPEFIKALGEAGIPEETLKALATDVNSEVFMRLREEERAEKITPVAKKPPVSMSPAATAMPTPTRTQVPIYSPMPAPAAPPAPPIYVPKAVERPAIQKQVPPPAVLPGQTPVPVVALERIQAAKPPVPPPTPKPVPPPPVRVERPTPSPAPETDAHARIMHTMARDMQAVKSGTDPMRVAHPAPPAWATAPTPKPAPTPEQIVSAPVLPTQTKPIPAQPTPPIERVAPMLVPPVQPHAAPAPEVPKPAAPHVSHSPQALTQHLKQYGVDPYREPVE